MWKKESQQTKNRFKVRQRFLNDLKNRLYEFDPKEAEFVIGIIEKTFVHAQGEMLDGTPLEENRFY